MSDKKKTERIKNGTLQFLNVKLLPNDGENDYISFFQNLLKMDYAIKDKGDKFLTLVDFGPCPDFRDNDRGNGLYKVWRGRIVEYIDLDPNGFIDLETKENINKPFDVDNIGANQKRGYFYFIPEAHRLTLLKNSEISIQKIKKYIEEAGERLFFETNTPNKKVYAIVEKTKDTLAALQRMHAVVRLKAKLSYTNKDHTEGFEALFDDRLNNSGATEVDMDLQANKKESLNFEQDSLAASIVKITESNGDLEARVIENEGDKVKPFNTQEYTRVERIKYKLSEFPNVIYNRVMNIFRPD